MPCPYLGGTVELTEEREHHIQAEHPDLLPEHRARIMDVLARPQQVRCTSRVPTARLLSRYYPDLKGGKHVVVVVVTDSVPSRRCWVVTAYMARRLVSGEVEWKED